MGQKIRWINIFLIFVLFFPSMIYANEKKPVLNSETAILIDAKSGEVLFEKNARQKMYPASITKIITGILAVESGKLDEWVTTSKRARWAEGTRIYLAQDEKKPLKEIVYGLMMNSGNDAAIAIAEHLGGSVEEFARVMNDFVSKKLGLTGSHFMNPHGLFDEQHYTTAYDMAMIAKYAMKNPTFREIVGTKTLPWHGKEWESTLVNHNKLLWRYEGTTGIKNGYVAKAGNTLVTSAKRGGTELIAVCLKAQGSENVYKDTISLLDYGFSQFETVRLFSKGKMVTDSVGNHYLTTQDLYVTVSKGHIPVMKVNEKGNVHVYTPEEKTFRGVLNPVPKDILDQAGSILSFRASKKLNSLVEPIFVSLGLLFFMAFIFIKQRKRNEHQVIHPSERDSG